MLYRSRDYKFVSVDNLSSPKDFKRVYLHRKHRFYIGDVTDEYFMNRLIHVEKPDYIVNAISSGDIICKLSSINLLGKLNIPTIQLAYPSSIDKLHNECINNYAIYYGLNLLIFPNCFGLRQRSSKGISQMIKGVVGPTKTIYTYPEKWPWVYAEDVASLIWYIIENNIRGIIQMPILGNASLQDISESILVHFSEYAPKIVEINKTEIFKLWRPICLTYDKFKQIDNWMPDSDNLALQIDKTVRWYKANRWAIDV
jgi:nucleoside-diphosphate-sugar epimerase